MSSFNPCIIIPVYNHAEAIRVTVNQVRKIATSICIILINDGSEFSCGEVLREIAIDGQNIDLVELPENRGKGGAVKAGLRQAAQLGYSHGLQLDADGQHDTNDIQNFLAQAEKFPQAMIVGTPDFDEDVPTLRYYARYLTHVWVWINTLSFQIRDSMCGFRVYPVLPVNVLIASCHIGDRMDFDVEVLVRWSWTGGEMKQLPTRVKYPIDGVSHFRHWHDNFLITKMHTRLFFMMLIRSPTLIWRRLKENPTQSKGAAHWSGLQEKGTVIGIGTLLAIYRFLGRTPFLLVLYPVVLYYFAFSPTARNASMFYLSRVRAQQEFSTGQSIYRLSYRHFMSFAQGLLDKLIAWLGAIRYEHVDFPDQPKFFELMDGKKGALIIGSHLGNLEIMRALSAYNSHIRLNILVHTKHAEKFNQLLKRADETAQLNMIQVSEITPATAILLQDKLAQGEFIVIVGDRVPIQARSGDINSRTSVVEFLGEPARFPQGPYLIGAILKCPVYTLFCLSKGGRYEISFKLFADRIKLTRGDRPESLKHYAQKFARVLEEQTLHAPLQWYNFFPFWLNESSIKEKETIQEAS